MSWLGGIGGGLHVLGFGWGVVCVAVWSLLVLFMALRAALPADVTASLMSRMEETA